jgi:hypothetical protein
MRFFYKRKQLKKPNKKEKRGEKESFFCLVSSLDERLKLVG